MRARLEVDFGLSAETLQKYDEISKEDLTSASPAGGCRGLQRPYVYIEYYGKYARAISHFAPSSRKSALKSGKTIPIGNW